MADLVKRLTTLRENVAEEAHSMHTPIIDDAQFTNDDVLSVTGISRTQLHNWVSRGWVKLKADQNPGRGKRRLYTGEDVIAIEVANALQPFGLLHVGEQFMRTRKIPVRIHRILTDPRVIPDYGILICPTPEDIMYIPVGSEVTEQEEPPCYGVVGLDVDSLIIGTLERLQMVINGQDVPSKEFPKPPTSEEVETEFLEFQMKLDTDDRGQRIFVGLTYEETQYFEAYLNIDKNGPEHIRKSIKQMKIERDKYLELNNKHEIARFKRIEDTKEERWQELLNRKKD